MKQLFAMIALSLALLTLPAQAGNCTNTWDTASDGSVCGDRASTRRPGGR